MTNNCSRQLPAAPSLLLTLTSFKESFWISNLFACQPRARDAWIFPLTLSSLLWQFLLSDLLSLHLTRRAFSQPHKVSIRRPNGRRRRRRRSTRPYCRLNYCLSDFAQVIMGPESKEREREKEECSLNGVRIEFLRIGICALEYMPESKI